METRDSWGQQNFADVLQRELLSLPAGTLPLHLATEQGGIVDDTSIEISLLGSEEQAATLEVRAWVFFEEIISGCNCDDDPMSTRSLCTLLVRIDKTDATADFSVLEDR